MKVHLSYSTFMGEPEYRHYKTSTLIYVIHVSLRLPSSCYFLSLLFKNVVIQNLPQQIVEI